MNIKILTSNGNTPRDIIKPLAQVDSIDCYVGASLPWPILRTREVTMNENLVYIFKNKIKPEQIKEDNAQKGDTKIILF